MASSFPQPFVEGEFIETQTRGFTTHMLMDNFRVFEPIVSFSAEAHARSLSWIIFNDLRESGNPLYGSAGATSMLTIIGVVFLLTPVLIRTWRDFNRKTH